jgi:hypothetical protein
MAPPSNEAFMKKWVVRIILGLSVVNFVLSIWFSQYVTNMWLLFFYVIGSLLLMCGLISLAE